jgi:L-methionine (R)-S-oxide reductase
LSENVYIQILMELRRFAESAKDLSSLQRFTVEIMLQRLPYYNWAGFYMLDSNDPRMLVLGSFRGGSGEYLQIRADQKLCGAALVLNETVIVDVTNSDPRYLASSPAIQSQIAVPLRVNDALVGEIDIDSQEIAAFSMRDKEFLEDCAVIVARFIERTGSCLKDRSEVELISAGLR